MTRTVYECSAHGIVETTEEYREYDFDHDEPGPVQHVCPVHVGYEGMCHTPLNGPITVEVTE